uniref:Uncharacterized protein n=1 Tax=uncultured Caudovirales phage TaxID=2100421 RepID=A0A6J7WZ11_9CAUD|nr:hypothetical protein UFOVP385_17 [uncultured Caudovirales phage]
MKVEKATLDFGSKPQQQVDENSLYLIDFTKITSVNDLVLILASVGFSFSSRHPHFEQIKGFLNLDNPIPSNMPVAPKQEEIKLPKLKQIK